MAFQFKKATKAKSKLRAALCGPSGSGKTYTALALASELAKSANGRVLMLDTERGSASKYADIFDFDCFDEWGSVGGYDPRKLIEALAQAEGAYAVAVIDSLSHFWFGKGGELELVDKAAARQQSKNSFTAWKEVTPVHNALVDTLLGVGLHVICTMRTKTEWVLEKNDRGQSVPRKVGMAPIMRDGIEYEFDVCGDMDADHTLAITKSRCPALSDGVFRLPGAALASPLIEWLSSGTEVPPSSKAGAPVLPFTNAPTGTKEAQEEVRDRKIADLRRQAAEQATTHNAVDHGYRQEQTHGGPLSTPPPQWDGEPFDTTDAAAINGVNSGDIQKQAEAPDRASILQDARLAFTQAGKFDRLAFFQSLKKRFKDMLGDDGEPKYREFLNAAGVAKSDEFKSLGPARDCAVAMLKYLHDLEEKHGL